MSNRLKDSTSPYLLQHADNPVDWYPWGPEALQAAKDQDKPIFLSIGYAACHWCHVMAHESFEDQDTAALMNEHFVNIKVDREERPDLDSLYMDAVVAMTGHGGWPMSVFLTPEGEPFYGGTYFPPARRFNMPAFRELLIALSEKWAGDRQELLEMSSELTERIGSAPSLIAGEQPIETALFDGAAESLFRSYDWTDGGWGRAPKFPQPMTIEFLLRRHLRERDKLALDMSEHALRAMAAGGIYDHLAGGFARYSVDEKWLVPHFEKMLYDNAQLARAYLQGWLVTGDEQLLQFVEETLDFMIRDMRHPEGGFFSSYDADSEGEEGKYYVWSLEEIDAALSDSKLSAIVVAAYGVTPSGNFEGQNILFRATDEGALAEQFSISETEVASRLAVAKETLLRVREKRIPPGLDDKVLTAWNGLALIALSEAARATGRSDYLEAAQLLADFLLENLIQGGRLLRSWREGQASLTAYLEDHAALGLGLLALYQTDFNTRWYQAAVDQGDEILASFADERGGFFDTRDDHEKLIARPKSIQDSPTPSGNTMAALLLLTLGAFEGEGRYIEPAESTVRAIASTASQHPSAFAGWLNAIDFALGPQLQLALAGDPTSADFADLVSVSAGDFMPNMVTAGGVPGTSGGPTLMAERAMRDGLATAYLCQSFACQLPTTDSEVLSQQIEAALEDVG